MNGGHFSSDANSGPYLHPLLTAHTDISMPSLARKHLSLLRRGGIGTVEIIQ